MQENSCVIELSFLRANNEYYIKELAYYILETEDYAVYTMKPPYPYAELTTKDKYQCSWITRHLTSIHWGEGDHNYDQLENIMRSISDMNLKFFAKGLEKTTTLIRYLNRPVTNIETIGCPKLCTLPEASFLKCKYHVKDINCCLFKACRIARWLTKIN